MSYVYLIENTESNLKKIGFSNNPEARLKNLQSGNSSKLELKVKFETEYPSTLETSLKNWFKLERVLGEWFDITLTVDEFTKLCEKHNSNIKTLMERKNPFI